MSPLRDIAVRIEAPARSGGLGGGVAAVLSELLGMLERVALGGEPTTIDLRSLPMSPEDRIQLQETLGRGEVQATLSAAGLSSLQETGISGIWWVEHRDLQGELVAELIEVSPMPAILQASAADMTAGASALRNRLAPNRAAAARMNHATRG